ADIGQPMWDAVFSDPEDMRTRNPEQLRVIEQRVQDTIAGTDVTVALIRKLSNLPRVNDLLRLSFNAGINSNTWFAEGRLADEAERLVAAAIQSGRQQALLQAVQMRPAT